MKRLLRILLVCTFPFLGLSGLLGVGLCMASLFVIPLTVENQTGQRLLVTPVGTVHAPGPPRKEPLPLMLWRIAVPLPKAGAFRLEPHATKTFFYDRDDVTCTELVLEDEQGRLRQSLVAAGAGPGHSQDSFPEHHTLTGFESLPEVGPDVLAASVAARWRPRVFILLLQLFLPPAVFAALLYAHSRLPKAAPPGPPRG